MGIAERTIRTIILQKCENTIISEDNRGRHNNHRKLEADLHNSIVEHISSIPRVESHYSRSDSAREYIDGALSIADMHRNYEEQRVASGKSAANYAAYLQIFNTEFNIGFFKPKKDQCDFCESYKNSSEEEKVNMQQSFDKHQKEKQLSREEKKNRQS